MILKNPLLQHSSNTQTFRLSRYFRSFFNHTTHSLNIPRLQQHLQYIPSESSGGKPFNFIRFQSSIYIQLPCPQTHKENEAPFHYYDSPSSSACLAQHQCGAVRLTEFKPHFVKWQLVTYLLGSFSYQS